MWWVIDPPEERNAHEILQFPPVMCLRLMKLLLSGCSLISTIMDIIHQCLSLTPVPHLAPAFTLLKFIYSVVAQVQTIQQQVDVLVQFVEQLLYTLDKDYYPFPYGSNHHTSHKPGCVANLQLGHTSCRPGC